MDQVWMDNPYEDKIEKLEDPITAGFAQAMSTIETDVASRGWGEPLELYVVQRTLLDHAAASEVVPDLDVNRQQVVMFESSSLPIPAGLDEPEIVRYLRYSASRLGSSGERFPLLLGMILIREAWM